MSANSGDNTNLRLKAVLDILAAAAWSGEKLNAGAVLAEAIRRFPLNERESELLSGGVPRGHKTLTTATAKLVKAGWLVKGRSGWTATEDGLRATVAFPDADTFSAALASGTPVPADVPLPAAPVDGAVAPAAEAPAAAESGAGGSKLAKAVGKVAEVVEDVVKPARKARPKKAAAESPADAPADDAAGTADVPAADALGSEAPAADVQGSEVPASDVLDAARIPQPDAVAIVGDFSVLLGAGEDWDPKAEEVQMRLDPADQLWKLTADLPAGLYTYKVALNRSWEENYGAWGVRDGANHELHHPGGTVTFRYDHVTRDVSTV